MGFGRVPYIYIYHLIYISYEPYFCTFVLFFALSVTVYATDATLNTRNLRVADIAKAEAKAKAIVAGLGQLCDSTRENVHIVIANRYLELCAIHNRYDNRNDSIRALKLPKQKEANAFERSYYNYNNDLYRTRFDFIAWLNFYLTDAQVETVKNLMTNNYLFVRYNDFIDLLPSLTEAERERVYHWLVEAREFSMDFWMTGRCARCLLSIGDVSIIILPNVDMTCVRRPKNRKRVNVS